MRTKLFYLILFSAISFTTSSQNYTDFVDPFIGTAKEGYSNPGAVLPWGISVCPLNCYDPVKGVRQSPYIFGEKYISGFSHFNLSGTGCPDMSVCALMPTTGEVQTKAEKYWSDYSEEKASPGYYSVTLNRYKTKVELSATQRTSISRYTFPKGKSNVLINAGLSLSSRKGALIRRVSNAEVEGFKVVGGFCGMNTIQTIYFVVRISKAASTIGVWNSGQIFPDFQKELAGDDVGAFFSFDTEEGESVLVKTGISAVSIENARKNLNEEQPGFDFENVKLSAARKWEKELSKIKVEGGSREDMTMFYTALYHILQHPTIVSDSNGEYPSYQGNGTSKAKGYDHYTVFSLWDTYRNVHPLLSLVYPQRQLDMVKTMISMYKDGGWLPKWELAGMETYVMVGDPSLSVIADSYLRGLRNFDVELAYEAMKHNAMTEESVNPMRPGLDNLLKYGYIPEDEKNKRGVWGSVSTALEYCIADWNLAQMARALGKEADYKLFSDRSLLYRNYFDPKINFLRPRLSNGNWHEPFDPEKDKGLSHSPSAPGFVEGNSWQYTFFIPHDIPGLIKLMGGEKKFTEKLAACLDSAYFVMHNEPDMAYPYLFNYAKGEEWRTQKYVRDIIYKNFNVSPSGIPGNDDCGTTSAWLLFSMMGFYPDCPGNMDFQLASPVFSKITISLDPAFYSGKEFVIEASGTGKENYVVRTRKLNGAFYKAHTLNHQDIIKGGKLTLVLKSGKRSK